MVVTLEAAAQHDIAAAARDSKLVNRIRAAIYGLGGNPTPANSVELRGGTHNIHRLSLGGAHDAMAPRILYHVGQQLIVTRVIVPGITKP